MSAYGTADLASTLPKPSDYFAISQLNMDIINKSEKLFNKLQSYENDCKTGPSEIAVKRLNPKATIPALGTSGAAGYDLSACLKDNETIIIPAGGRKIIPTQISMAIPEGYCGYIMDRSGLAAKNGLTKLAGLIDSDYRGPIGVVIYNSSGIAFTVNHGDRIAQMAILRAYTPSLNVVDELPDTTRGAGGFGSTGVSSTA